MYTVKRPGYVDFCRRLEVLFPLFEKYGIHATGKDGWIPDEETAAEQTEAFQRNFSKEDLEIPSRSGTPYQEPNPLPAPRALPGWSLSQDLEEARRMQEEI